MFSSTILRGGVIHVALSVCILCSVTAVVADIYPGGGSGFVAGWADIELPNGSHLYSDGGHSISGWEGFGGSAGGNRTYQDAVARGAGNVGQGAWNTFASIYCNATSSTTGTETIIATSGGDSNFSGAFAIDTLAVYSVAAEAETNATGNFSVSAHAAVSGPNLNVYVSASGAASRQEFPATLMILTPGNYSMSASAHSDESAPGTPGTYSANSVGNISVNYVSPVPGCGYLADGDMNGDLVVNGRDVQAFADCLLGTPTTDEACHGDFNRNEALDTEDVAGMVSALLQV